MTNFLRDMVRPNRLALFAAIAAAVSAASLPLLAQEKDKDKKVAATAKADDKKPGTPGVAPKPPEPGSQMARAAESGALVYLPDSFAAVEQLREGLDWARQGRSQDAILKFQKIIDEFGSKLVYLNNDSYVSITDYCRTQLVAMPAVAQGQYETLFGGQAKKVVDEAMAARDLSALGRACDQYFCSDAAMAGLAYSAEMYFERGDFSAATQIWRRLAEHPRANDQKKAEFLHHAVIAAKLAGRDGVAKTLRDKLESDFDETAGKINGKEVNLLKSADDMLSRPAWDMVMQLMDEWPQIGGSASRNVTLNVNSTANAKLWSFNFDDPQIVGEAQKTTMPPLGRGVYRGQMAMNYGSLPQIMPSHPVMTGGTLLIHTGDCVTALSANAGNLQWSYPQRDKVVLRNAAAQEQAILSGNGKMMRIPFVDACAAFENEVYAILPGGGSAQSAGRGYYGYNISLPTRVVALNRVDGSEIWPQSVAASDVQLKDTTGNGMLMFVGAPVVTRQGVFVMAKRPGADNFTQYYLVRIDRRSGEVVWACYICSAGTLGYNVAAGVNRVPIPTVADDVVYVSTGQGADAAIDANAGRIQWLHVTENAKVKGDSSGIQNFETIPSWRFNAPIIAGDKVITCEVGGSVRMYDRFTGNLVFNKGSVQQGNWNADVIAGVYEDELIVIGTTSGNEGTSDGRTIRAVDVKTAKETWTMDPRSASPTGKLYGRPFMATGLLYLPFENGLMLIDLKKRSVKDFTMWPKGETGLDGNLVTGKPGNILVTSEQVIVVGDREVSGYSRWETAFSNRQARIKAAPMDPEPYLSLAEISFRTNHYDLAEENLAKAVQLVIVDNVRTTDGFRQRLYRTCYGFASQLLDRGDIVVRARARFYFDQCKLSAYDAETQAEWRLTLARLSRFESKWAEAADLYNAVLGDSGMRDAPFRRLKNAVTRAGMTAEREMGELIRIVGTKQAALKEEDKAPKENSEKDSDAKVEAAGRQAVYRPYETMAEGALAKARTEQGDARVKALAAIVDSYPNSIASLAAANDLAAAFKSAGKPMDAITPLLWLTRRVKGNAMAQVVADLAVNHASLNRWNAAFGWADRGARVYAAVPITIDGKETNFSDMRKALQGKMPANVDGRKPNMPLPQLVSGDNKEDSAKDQGLMLIMNKEVSAGPDSNPKDPKDALLFANGALLTPVEQSQLYRRADAFFTYAGGTVRMFAGPDYKEKWKTELVKGAGNTPPATILLGSHGDVSLFVQANRALALDNNTGAIKWAMPLEMGSGEKQRINDINAQKAAALANEAQRIMVLDQQAQTYTLLGMSRDAKLADGDIGRNVIFDESFSASYNFSTMRLIGNSLVIVTGSSMSAYDLATGKVLWKDRPSTPLPEGAPAALVGNEDFFIAQMESENATPTYRIIDVQTGKKIGDDIRIENERGVWRGISAEGILYIVTDRAIYAYDCKAMTDGSLESRRALWQRNDFKVRWGAACAISLDGLVVVQGDSNPEIACLMPEDGQNRWPRDQLDFPPRLSIPTGVQQPMTYLKAYVDGEQIVYQTPTGFAAFFTSDCSSSWSAIARFDPSQAYPPMYPAQMAGQYLLTLAIGPVDNVRRDGIMVAFDGLPNSGSVRLRYRLVGMVSKDSVPAISPTKWQVVDNAVVMELSTQNFLLKAAPYIKTDEKKTDEK